MKCKRGMQGCILRRIARPECNPLLPQTLILLNVSENLFEIFKERGLVDISQAFPIDKLGNQR